MVQIEKVAVPKCFPKVVASVWAYAYEGLSACERA
jgi:hypothetical protein